MADLIELHEKARLLNLQNLAHGKIDLNQETVSNIDYLDYILSQELELRRQAAIKRHTNASRLPKREFDPARLKPGIAWQVEQLENMQWICAFPKLRICALRCRWQGGTRDRRILSRRCSLQSSGRQTEYAQPTA